MRVKKFTGSTMQEAVAQIRDEFGRDAVILDTRLAKRGGIWGLFGKKYVEVTAALDTSSRDKMRQESGKAADESTPTGMAVTLQSESMTKPARAAHEQEPMTVPAQLAWQLYQETLQNETAASRVETANTGADDVEHWPPVVAAIQGRLIDSEVDAGLATAIVQSVWQEIKDQPVEPEAVEVRVKDRIAAMLRCVSPWDFSEVKPRVVALVGPTGVGKTTTLAKIAANYSLIAGAEVALVTLDTYRIAAVEQLRTYAEIIGIPLKVAETPDEVRQCVESWSYKDLILIDTAGTSQRGTERLQEVGIALQPITGIECHLVFSVTTRYRDLADIIRRFDKIGFDHLIATKLDETNCYGTLLTAYALARRPFSFLTDGQDVPECIQVAEATHISELIMGDA
ncbi:MAG: flagellar biosynthesis protein FlhF [Firmicutes bacterium]|nr:flagellar biosynthesis protein FlhF [Bacillota bacterium]